MRRVEPVKFLSYEERKAIEILVKKGLSCGEIAKRIGRSKNGVVVEVRRGGKEEYNAKKAHKEAIERLKRKTEKCATEYKKKRVAFHMKQRIESLEMQMEILHDTIKELMDGKKD